MDDQIPFHAHPPHSPFVAAAQPEPTEVPSAYGAPAPIPLPSRAAVRAMRMQEKAGVPYWLKWTGVEATVRMLSFADKTLAVGLPNAIRIEINDAYAAMQSRSGANKTLDDVLRTAAGDERLANAVCVAGFVSPRLVMTEAELDGGDGCWLVTDLHIEERREYLAWVLGRAPEEVIKRVQNFRAEGLAGG